MSATTNKLFRLFLGITGCCEMLLGLLIVFFATYLQQFLAQDILDEPLYLRILGMMDFYIGGCYLLIGLSPQKYALLNKTTCPLRLGLSILFFVEGFWLLTHPGTRLIYQLLAGFDFILFVCQYWYLRRSKS